MAESTAPVALVCFAHPDDAEFMCAGTVARWAREGVRVIYVVLTDGSKGTDDPAISPAALVAQRVQEQREAARLLGVAEVLFLGYEDGRLQDTEEVRRALTRLIRQYRPERVIAPDPTARWFGQHYINHPDHVAAGNATVAAVSLYARNRLSFPGLLAEGLEPHKVRELYLAATTAPDRWVDITDTLDLKIAALRAHRSQLGDWDPADEVRRWAAEEGRRGGVPYAEAFKYFALD